MENPAEIERHFRWLTRVRLHVIQELSLGDVSSDCCVRWLEEENERIRQALETSDRRDEDEALLYNVRAGLNEWWTEFPESKLLSKLFRRAARRRARVGSDYSSRPPDLEEAERVANALLTDVNGPMKLDLEYDSEAIALVVGVKMFRHIDEYTQDDLMDRIRRSESSRAYYDALWLVCDALEEMGKPLAAPLYLWRQAATLDILRRPPLLAAQSRRPVTYQKLVRDYQIQFVIEILRRLGLRPQGGFVSGCSVVSEALDLSDSAVVGIWQRRLEKGSFEPVLRKLVVDMAERTGLQLADEPCTCDPPCSQDPAR